MARPYKELRTLLYQHDITNKMLAEELNIGVDTVSRKMNCHSAWTDEQMWKIMDMIKEPDHRLHEIFPRNGINEPGVQRRRPGRQIA